MERVQNSKQPGLNRRTSLKLIDQAINEGWLKQLAFYHLLKFRFKSSCIYDYKSRMNELSGMFDICPKTLYSYLNILRYKNLVYDHSNNLIIKSIREFSVNRKCTILIEEDYTLNDIVCLLYGKLIERKARKQAFGELIKSMGGTDKQRSKFCERSPHDSLVTLSYRLIAKVLKVSEFKSFKVLKNLVRLGVIKIHKQPPIYLNVNFTELEYVEDLPGHRFNIGNKLYAMYGSEIEFLQFPILLKPMTLKVYKRLKNSYL